MSRSTRLTRLSNEFVWNSDLERAIGSAWANSPYGELCQEAIDGGWDMSYLYDSGSERWGNNFSKVVAVVAVLRGATSYRQYVNMIDGIKPVETNELATIEPVTKTTFAKLTGIKAPNDTQTERTRRYRQKQREELLALRKKLNSDKQ